MDFERLSTNIIEIIDEVLSNQVLVNYIGHDSNNPSAQNINPKDIAPNGINERIFPYPFDTSYTPDVRSQLHVYYPNFLLVNNGNANQVALIFDIVVHKHIWLLVDDKKRLLRPYQIAKHIYDTFNEKRIDGIGKIHFKEGLHTIVNGKFEGLRLVATFTEF